VHEPGLAADLTVLDILLGPAAARIDGKIARLPTVWAGDRSHVVELGIKIVVGRTERFEIVKVHTTGCDPTPPPASVIWRA
jgi:hypothetical protein